MRKEMKWGLGIGLVALISIVAISLTSNNENPAPPVPDSLMNDSETAEGDASEGTTEEYAATNTEDRAAYSSMSTTEEETGRWREPDAGVETAERGFTDAADAPTTGSEERGFGADDADTLVSGGETVPGVTSGREATGTGFGNTTDTDTSSESDDAGLADATGTGLDESSGASETGTEDGTERMIGTGLSADSSETSESDTGQDRTAPSPSGTRDTLAGSWTESSGASTSEASERTPVNVTTRHTIESGDTFTALAVRYFGHAKHTRLIEQANPDVNPLRLLVGKELVIPDTPLRKAYRVAGTASSGTSTSERASTTAGTRTSGSRETPAIGSSESASPVAPRITPPIPEDRKYVVKGTDNGWYDLAERLLDDGGRWPELYEMNKDRLPDPNNRNLLPAGLEIMLPER